MIAICLLKLTKSPGSGPGVKNSENIFLAKYEDPQRPPLGSAEKFIHPKAHTLRTSSLVKEPRFFNAVDIASFRCEKMRDKTAE